MSSFIAAAQPQIVLLRNDRRLVQVEFQNNEPPEDFSTPWWPASCAFVGDRGVDVGLLAETRGFEDPEITRGISARLGFVGVSRDQYGTPLAACTVRVFRTSDGVMVHETISDANGAFMGCAYDTSAYFLVIYKSGSPDVFGTTVNTLVGS